MTTSDKTLLELAAKAAGIEVRYQPMSHRFLTEKQLSQSDGYYFAYWDPLTDDGDALRLAVKFKFTIEHWSVTSDGCDRVSAKIGQAPELYNNDPYAATRRAIVRAAAAIGEKL